MRDFCAMAACPGRRRDQAQVTEPVAVLFPPALAATQAPGASDRPPYGTTFVGRLPTSVPFCRIFKMPGIKCRGISACVSQPPGPPQSVSRSDNDQVFALGTISVMPTPGGAGHCGSRTRACVADSQGEVEDVW